MRHTDYYTNSVVFKVYDMDRDGFISNGELFLVLKMMVGGNLKDQQLQQIVDKTIMEVDKNGDGKIDFYEFLDMVSNTDVAKQLTLEVCYTRARLTCRISFNVCSIDPFSIFENASQQADAMPWSKRSLPLRIDVAPGG